MKAHRVTQERLLRLEVELTRRDWAVVEMLQRVKLATGNQLRRATTEEGGPAAERAGRRQLARLLRWRVVARLERRQGGLGRGSESWTYGLDTAGQRLIHRATGVRRPLLPRPAMWLHALAGAEVYARLVEALRATDRRLEQWQGEPECWRDFADAYGQTQRLKPDAFVCVSGPDYEDLRFLEIDTGSQSRTVIRSKLDAYRRYAASGQEQEQQDGVFPLTVFITNSPARHALLVDLIGQQPPEVWSLFAVGLVDDAARLLMGGN